MKRDLKERFESHIMPEPNTGCWLWIGSLNKQGYGHFQLSNRPQRANRVSFELYKGLIPDGLIVCHSCDVTMCVNPDHLFLGTHKDNTQDMIKKNRKFRTIGVTHGMSRLTDKDVRQIRIDYSNGFKLREIAPRFKVSFQHISDIINYKRWGHL